MIEAFCQQLIILSYKRDYSNTNTSRITSSSRPSNKSYDEEHSEEYKKIMGNTDKYLTMAKYTNNENKDVNNMIENERRSKAYSKIIGEQTAQSLVSWHFMAKKVFNFPFEGDR